MSEEKMNEKIQRLVFLCDRKMKLSEQFNELKDMGDENMSEKLQRLVVLYDSKRKLLEYFNELWFELVFNSDSDFSSLNFDVLRTNGNIENDWILYNPINMQIGGVTTTSLCLGVGDNFAVQMVKIDNNNKYLDKRVNIADIKRQVFEKYGKKYEFLKHFPDSFSC